MREDMARTALAGGGEEGAADEGEGKVRLQSSYRACTRDDGGRAGTPHAITEKLGGVLSVPPCGWSLDVSGGAPPPQQDQEDGEAGDFRGKR
jgi:hypothetical protein